MARSHCFCWKYAQARWFQDLHSVRLEFDGLGGLVDRAPGRQGAVKISAALGVVGLEADGLAVLGDGLVQLPLLSKRGAEVVVEDGVFRVEFDGLLVTGDRLVQLLLLFKERSRGCCGR